MKERKLKKYREWFRCPYLVKEHDCVTTDPYPIYQDCTWCRLDRYSKSGYSGYDYSEEGAPCEKCKLPITREQMHDILAFKKRYNSLKRRYDKALSKVKLIKVEDEALFTHEKIARMELDELDPNYSRFMEVYEEYNSLIYDWFNN